MTESFQQGVATGDRTTAAEAVSRKLEAGGRGMEDGWQRHLRWTG